MTAAITDFELLRFDTDSATFTWTIDGDVTDGTYTLWIEVLNGERVNVTFAQLPYTLTGLKPGTSYAILLILDLNGSPVSQATRSVTTAGSAAGGGGSGSPPTQTVRRLISLKLLSISRTAAVIQYQLSGTAGYKLQVQTEFLDNNSDGGTVDITSFPNPVTLGVEPSQKYRWTFTCLSEGTQTSASVTGQAEARPPTAPTAIAWPYNAVDAQLPGSDIGSQHSRLISAIITGNAAKSALTTAWLLVQENGVWNAPLDLGTTSSYFGPARGTVQQRIISPTFAESDHRSFTLLGTGIDSFTVREIVNEKVGFPVPPPVGGDWIAPPAVASATASRVDLFVIGTNARLYHTAIIDQGAPSAFAHFAEVSFTGSPAAVAAAPNQIEIFAIRTGDLALLHATYRADSNTTSAWQPANATTYGHIGACKRAEGVVDVVIFGSDLAIWHATLTNGAWSAWQSLGGAGILGRTPAVASRASNRLDVCVVGTDFQYYHKWWDGTRWFPSQTGWEPLGLTTLPGGLDPSWCVLDQNSLMLFAGDTHANVVTRELTGSAWLGWTAHTGATYSVTE